ncbi:Uncharacterized protein TCM_024720 [Theobroma cacao]|uniref:Uncharacterized protein n=1 Tax=Theobroma cacao TaxID=3641 RepID=A0A061EW42_THECC|nr:Uncharacterized protein TCM_024720 [Theobroma cacao]
MEKLVRKPCEVSKSIREKNVCRGFATVVTDSMGVRGRDNYWLNYSDNQVSQIDFRLSHEFYQIT